MPCRMRSAGWLMVVAMLVTPHLGVAAGQADECADAYELTQSEQKAGRLLEARNDARLCATKCPAPLASDCSQWDTQITAQIPSFVVHARGASGAPLLVEVLVDGGAATFTDVGSIEAEPGPHRLLIRHAGTSMETSVQLVAGVRNQLVEVTIAETPPAVHASLSEPPSAPRPLEEHAPPVPGWRWALGGVGLAALATGGAISISGEVLASELRSECKPHCSQAQADEVVERWVIGGTVMGVGSAMLLAALFWPAGSSEATRTGRGSAPRVSVTPAGVVLEGTF
jgi:hypothetical protein